MALVRAGLNEIVLPDTLLLLTAQDISIALSGEQNLDVKEVITSGLHPLKTVLRMTYHE